jgi:hypothetical protein
MMLGLAGLSSSVLVKNFFTHFRQFAACQMTEKIMKLKIKSSAIPVVRELWQLYRMALQEGMSVKDFNTIREWLKPLIAQYELLAGKSAPDRVVRMAYNIF